MSDMNVPQVVSGAPQQFTILKGKAKKEVFLFEVCMYVCMCACPCQPSAVNTVLICRRIPTCIPFRLTPLPSASCGWIRFARCCNLNSNKLRVCCIGNCINCIKLVELHAGELATVACLNCMLVCIDRVTSNCSMY